MHLWPLLVSTAVIATLPVTAASAQPAQAPVGVTSDAAAACAGLLAPTQIQQSQSVAMDYAYSQVTSQNNNTNQGSSGHYFAIGGSENYSTENQRAESIGLKWDLSESSSYFARYVPANQSTDYLTCVMGIEGATDGGAGIQFEDDINDLVNFTIKVRGLSGINLSRRLVVWTNGKPTGSWVKTYSSGPSSVPIAIKWPDPNQPLVVRARMRQVGKNGGYIGSEAKYVLLPNVIERKEHHISPDVEARAPNRGPGGLYPSGPSVVRAAADEVLIGNSLQLPSGTWLHKTWGAKDIPCSPGGFAMDDSSDASVASGHATCYLGPADENPGYSAHFEVDGVHFSVPVPNPGVTMIERQY